MSEQMYWYDTGASVWRLTDELYVHDGTSWQNVIEAWIWNGAWRRCFVQAGSLDSLTVFSSSPDTLSIGWTYTASNPSEWLMSLEYSFDNGSNWTYYFENLFGADDAQNPYLAGFDGIPGYTDLDNVLIRLSMRLNGTTHATGSPADAFPPY